jgi:hypothetical protein
MDVYFAKRPDLVAIVQILEFNPLQNKVDYSLATIYCTQFLVGILTAKYVWLSTGNGNIASRRAKCSFKVIFSQPSTNRPMLILWCSN